MCISLSTECNVLRYVIRWHLDDWADWLLPHWASRDPIGNGREPTIVLNCTQLYSMQAKDCTQSSLHIAYCTQTVQAPGCSPCSLTTRATNWCSFNFMLFFMSLMICSSAVLKCWLIMLVIGEITLHSQILQSLNRLARNNLQAFHFLYRRVSWF